jgi:dual-specificity kinase
MMEVVLGPMPDNYRRKAESTKPDYFHGGQVHYPNKETQPHSKRYMKRMKRLQDIVSGPAAFQKHNSRFLNLLQRLLAFDPAQR